MTVFVAVGFSWLAWTSGQTREASNRATEASTKATAALAQVQRLQVEVIAKQLRNEKICTDSHPEFCRALFDRLIRHTTDAQAKQWACEGLAHIFQAPIIRYLRRATRCPPPVPPPSR